MRTKNRWNVTLQREDGKVVETKFETFWRADQEDSADAVMNAAQAQAYISSGKQYRFSPISAALIEDEPIAQAA